MRHTTSTHPPSPAVMRKRERILDETALQTLFTHARTARAFLPGPVPLEILERLVELTELGPTESNSLPLRIVFIVSYDGKERLRPLLSRGNVDKTMAAPVTAVIAADLRFYEAMAQRQPAGTAHERFVADPANAERSARMNAALQSGYFLLAARALGLDVGPMAGFDRTKTDAVFLHGTPYVSLWLANLGYADDTQTPPRAPRLSFAEVAAIV